MIAGLIVIVLILLIVMFLAKKNKKGTLGERPSSDMTHHSPNTSRPV
jgi:hypothetical protein